MYKHIWFRDVTLLHLRGGAGSISCNMAADYWELQKTEIVSD